jgi:hypothetical protein
MTLWALRRLRCWWVGCRPCPQYLPLGPDGGPLQVGTHCWMCGRTEIYDLEKM